MPVRRGGRQRAGPFGAASTRRRGVLPFPATDPLHGLFERPRTLFDQRIAPFFRNGERG
jgi:hypothetical protein